MGREGTRLEPSARRQRLWGAGFKAISTILLIFRNRIKRNQSQFLDFQSTLPGNTDPSLHCNRKSITLFLMLENFPETSMMKQDVRPNKIPQGQSSRRPSPDPKMLIRISQGGSQNSDTKKNRLFIFWVRCSEYCPGLTKRRALH